MHTTPGNFENAALFLRLDLPSTLIRHENGTFRKRPSNRRNLKTLAFRFPVDVKHFENGAFRKPTSFPGGGKMRDPGNEVVRKR